MQVLTEIGPKPTRIGGRAVKGTKSKHQDKDQDINLYPPLRICLPGGGVIGQGLVLQIPMFQEDISHY